MIKDFRVERLPESRGSTSTSTQIIRLIDKTKELSSSHRRKSSRSFSVLGLDLRTIFLGNILKSTCFNSLEKSYLKKQNLNM